MLGVEFFDTINYNIVAMFAIYFSCVDSKRFTSFFFIPDLLYFYTHRHRVASGLAIIPISDDKRR